MTAHFKQRKAVYELFQQRSTVLSVILLLLAKDISAAAAAARPRSPPSFQPTF